MSVRSHGLWVVLPAALLSFSCAPKAEPPPKPVVTESTTFSQGVAGGSIRQEVEVSARVVSVDSANRVVRILDNDGRQFSLKLGPEVVNFDQIKAGDLVKVKVTREIAAAVGGPNPSEEEARLTVSAAAPGSRPSGFIGGEARVIGKVVSIDTTTRIALVEFSDGARRTFRVRPDVDLTRYAEGDRVVFDLAESVQIDVVRP